MDNVANTDSVQARLEVQLSSLLCASKHGRIAACDSCRRDGAILAKPVARMVLATVKTEYDPYGHPRKVDLSQEQASAVGRATDSLAKSYNERLNIKVGR